jgi:hypothetical protein
LQIKNKKLNILKLAFKFTKAFPPLLNSLKGAKRTGRQVLLGQGKEVGEVLAQLLVAAIYFHAGILHHALCFF